MDLSVDVSIGDDIVPDNKRRSTNEIQIHSESDRVAGTFVGNVL
jgi:hypothetical protein